MKKCLCLVATEGVAVLYQQTIDLSLYLVSYVAACVTTGHVRVSAVHDNGNAVIELVAFSNFK